MPPPSYILYTPSGSFRAFAPLIVAELNHIQLTLCTDQELVESIVAERSPTGKAPLLVIDERSSHNNVDDNKPKSHKKGDSVIFTSAAIARYLAGLRTDTGLLLSGGGYNGSISTFGDRAMVDNWIDWCGAELELPACVLFYPLVGYMDPSSINPEITDKAMADFKIALQVLEKHLIKKREESYTNQTNTDSSNGEKDAQLFLVKDSLTLADIVVVSTLVYPFRLVCTRDYLMEFATSVVQWFEQCIQLPEFQSTLGTIEICQTPMQVPAFENEEKL